MNVYEIITERILAKLEEGTVPWRKPWRGGEAGMPRNLQTGHPYRGINVFLLAAAGYESPYWLTFRQARQRGGSVRSGEHGTPVVFWKWHHAQEQDAENRSTRRRVPFLRYYTVFNLEQCDGVFVPVTSMPPQRELSPIKHCEEVIAGMPDAPAIQKGRTQAAYLPTRDTILMPSRSTFESAEAYYATLFHELAHATGHERRLARPSVMDSITFGSHDYSKEELVAEMGAAFLCGHTGIEAATLENAASYIDSWLRVLRGDSCMVVQAATHAQKAADFILGRTSESASDMADDEHGEAAQVAEGCRP
jgi:antirestriction protein ArdC